MRLLRETWDGIIKAAPRTGDIRPVGATSLAQELYAMLDDSVPQTQNAPVTINTPAGATGLTINASPGSNALQINGNMMLGNGATFTVCKGGSLDQEVLDLTGGGDTIGLDLKDKATQTSCPNGQVFQVGPDGPVITGSLNLNGGFYLWNGVPLMFEGGTTTFLGKVVSGTGNTYKVDIYGNGDTQPATMPGVTVTIPQIDSAETIPPGTWLNPIFQFTIPSLDPLTGQPITIKVYQCQIPVWLA
jgi:hypothetical protein